MKKSRYLVLILYIFLSFSCTTIEANLAPLVLDGSIDVKSDNGHFIQHAETSLVAMDISTESVNNGHDVAVKVYIKNKSGFSYGFDESSFKVEVGNVETNTWKDADFWTASEYLKSVESDIRAQKALGFIGLALTTVSDVFSVASHDSHSYHYDPYWSGVRYAFWVGMINNADLRNTDYLRNNLLFSTTIAPEGEYGGFFVMPADRGPDYRITYEMLTDHLVFYFRRQDMMQ